jgi:tetratricopeptide (TPR) repeat protein
MTTQSQNPVTNSFSIEQALPQAVAAHQAGRLQDAERFYRTILQVQPQHPVANHNLGVLAVQVKQPAAGLPHFKLALEADPNHGQYWISYIDALVQAGQIDEARRVLGRGRQIGLQGAAVEMLAEKLDDPYFKEMRELAALFNQGRHAECEAMARAMTERYPGLGFGWKVLGAILHKQGRLDEALQAKERATLLMPNDAEAHNNIGHSFQELGRYSDAVISLQKAMALDPNYASAYNNLGLTFQKMGRLDDAEASLRKAIALKQDYAEAHNNLGLTLEKKSRLQDAEACYRSALKIRPDYPEAYKNLGNIFLNRKMIKEAAACYERAIAIAPDYDAAHNNMGAAHFALGNIDSAILSYQKAHELKPMSPGALHNLGSALYQRGDIASAIDCFKKALAFEHDNWVVDSAAYLAVLYYWMDDLLEAKRVIGKFKGESHKGTAKLGAYFRYLELLITEAEKTGTAVNNGSSEVVHVIGESHAFSAHNVQVLHGGVAKKCLSRWILGCKQWHLGNAEPNNYKRKFEAEMAQLPPRSTILTAIGEIDCRPNEGILRACKKSPGKSIEEVVYATVNNYVQYVAGVAKQYRHNLIINGVPATNIPASVLTTEVREQLVLLIQLFNATLKEQALANGMDFLDVYALTDRGDGSADGQWHIDDVHLSPRAIAEAFDKCYVTAHSINKPTGV